MRLIFRFGSDPGFQQVFLFICEPFFRMGRRHFFIGIVTEDARDQLTRFGFPGDDSFQLDSRFTFIKTQIGFAAIGIRAVTMKAILRKNRPNVAIEDDIVCS